jgi:hypothetical protein
MALDTNEGAKQVGDFLLMKLPNKNRECFFFFSTCSVTYM